MTRRVVLVGAGLAHLQVLHEWRRRPITGAELTLVSPAEQYHPAMVPGFLHGAYEPPMLRIDVAALARCAGARFIDAAADRVSRADGVVDVGGELVGFDLCSLDIGLGVPDDTVPGLRARAIPLRPMSRALELRDRLDALIARQVPFHVVIAGAGAGGVEIAFAIRRRIADSAAPGRVTLAESGRMLLPGEPSGLRARLLGLLRDRGIGLVLGGTVVRVGDDDITLSSGATLPAELVVWTAGPTPPRLLARSDLPLDDAGFLRVDRALRAVGDATVFGAGDCVSLDIHRAVPRSAATAMRQGPVLLQNLRAALGAGRPRSYHPPRRALAFLDTADGRAAARWGALYGHGGWAWRLKRRADRRFVQRLGEPCDEIPVRGG